MTLELGEEIPETLYIAIAQIIAFAYQLQGKDFGNKSDAIWTVTVQKWQRAE